MVGDVRRGRPPRLEERELRARAIAIVLAHGYDGVTMSQIAEEIGLSVRTLHRYFPAKSDIVWGEIDHTFDALREGLANADPELSTIEAISAAVVTVFSGVDEGDTRRDRLQLIATTPELRATQSSAFSRWREDIAAFVALRLGEPPDGLLPVAVGAAVQEAIMQSLGWWAREGEPASPGDAVGRGLRGMAMIGRV